MFGKVKRFLFLGKMFLMVLFCAITFPVVAIVFWINALLDRRIK